MEHSFEEYSTEFMHLTNPVNYILIIANRDDDKEAVDLCDTLLNAGWYILSNKQLTAHVHFTHISKFGSQRSYNIHRIYNFS
jgi:hypothetical protein